MNSASISLFGDFSGQNFSNKLNIGRHTQHTELFCDMKCQNVAVNSNAYVELRNAKERKRRRDDLCTACAFFRPFSYFRLSTNSYCVCGHLSHRRMLERFVWNALPVSFNTIQFNTFRFLYPCVSVRLFSHLEN